MTQKRRKILTSLLVILVSLLISHYILAFHQDVENYFYDALYRNIQQREVSDDPIIIAIDQNTLNYFRHSLQVIWPWPRDIYKPIVDYLNHCNASVIAFDILFTSPGIDRANVEGSYTDSIFAVAMEQSGKTTLALQFEDSTLAHTALLEAGYLNKPPTMPDLIYHQFQKASLPIPTFQSKTALLGAVNIPQTSSGIVRKLPLLFEYQDKIIPHLSLSAFMIKNHIDSLSYDHETNRLIAGNLEIPLDKRGNYLINWYGKGGVNRSFQYYSFANLLKSAVRWQYGQAPILPEKLFKDKSIFIGSIAAGLLDMKSTPVTATGTYPGIEIYTTMFKNFQNQDFIQTFPLFWWSVVLFFFLVIINSSWESERFIPAALISLLFLIFPILISSFLFIKYEILFPLISFETGLIVTLLLSILIEYFWAGKTNRKLRKNFSRYLEPRLVKMMADSPDAITTTGDEVEATVLFSDIKNFTKLSNSLTSRETVNILNNYFENGERIIFQNNGMLDKYTGDGLMALFGVPVPDKNHAASACQAILDFHKMEMSKASTEKLPLKTRIGVHTGPLIAGNIGSSRRVDYTAIGSTVNIAARLEQLNKIFGTSNIISSKTCELLNNNYFCRDLHLYSVKGIKDPLHVYTVLCKKSEKNATIETLLMLHNNALDSFKKRKYNEAAERFGQLLKQYPNDSVATYFLKKCQESI